MGNRDGTRFAAFCDSHPPEEGGCDQITGEDRRRWHYEFDRNIVGVVSIDASSYSLDCGGTEASSSGSQHACSGEISVQSQSGFYFWDLGSYYRTVE